MQLRQGIQKVGQLLTVALPQYCSRPLQQPGQRLVSRCTAAAELTGVDQAGQGPGDVGTLPPLQLPHLLLQQGQQANCQVLTAGELHLLLLPLLLLLLLLLLLVMVVSRPHCTAACCVDCTAAASLLYQLRQVGEGGCQVDVVQPPLVLSHQGAHLQAAGHNQHTHPVSVRRIISGGSSCAGACTTCRVHTGDCRGGWRRQTQAHDQLAGPELALWYCD
jgi:hypothetical protein